MKQANVIKFTLVAIPLGMLLFGIGSLIYFMYSSKSEPHEGGRSLVLSRVRISENDLQAWVRRQASDIGPRPASDEKQMRITAKWIESELSEENIGYRPVVTFIDAIGGSYRNIEVEIPGTNRADEIVVVGAHYHTAAKCPGANGNGTGVAALLALSRYFFNTQNALTLRFVAFSNRRISGSESVTLGSAVYAKNCRSKGEVITGMINLDSLGSYSEVEGTQVVPPALRKYYPITGNFLSVIGDRSSNNFVEIFSSRIRELTDFPINRVTFSQGHVGDFLADHWSFRDQGYPALTLSDTASYRYPHYQKETDTLDKIDFVRFTKAVTALTSTLEGLLNPIRRREQ